METLSPATTEQQKRQEAQALESASKNRSIKRGLESLLEVQPDTPDNQAVKSQYHPLVSFIEELYAHPELLLTQPAPHKGINGIELPDWIHQRFQTFGTPEEIAQRSSSELFNNSWFLKKFNIDEAEILKIFSLKNTLRRRLQEKFDYNGKFTKSRFVRGVDFLVFLYEALTEQAVLNYSLDIAQRNIKKFAPALALQQPVSAFASPLEIPIHGAAYIGKTRDQHYIISDLPVIPLAKLQNEDAPFLLKIMISTMEHELIHAKQAELVENQSLVSGGQVNPMNRMKESRFELLAQRSLQGKSADDISIIFELREQEKAFRINNMDAYQLYRALAEGPAILGEFFLLRRKILQERDPVKKRELEKFMQKSLEHLRSPEMKVSCPFYEDGRKIYNKLQTEFGLQMFPEIFRNINFEQILKLKGTPEVMKKIMDDPRIIPGLSNIPEIEESLQQRPPTTSL